MPPAGTPPTAPTSVVSTMLSSPSSAATEATPSGMPMPRLVTAQGVSSMAARRAMIFRAPIGSGDRAFRGVRISPEKAGSYWVPKVCMWFSGRATTSAST